MDYMKKLKEPFPPNEIEWRIQSQGMKDNKPWVMVLAYVQARAIQERLDEIFGFDGWQDEYRSESNNIICRLSVKAHDSWIYKENGASETQVEAFKGGISGAFKRVAASGYGIGRYLYHLEVKFAEVAMTNPGKSDIWNKVYDKTTKTTFWWKTPELPSWAMPSQKIEPKRSTFKETYSPAVDNIDSSDVLFDEMDKENLFNADDIKNFKILVGKEEKIEAQVKFEFGKVSSSKQFKKSDFIKIMKRVRELKAGKGA